MVKSNFGKLIEIPYSILHTVPENSGHTAITDCLVWKLEGVKVLL